MVGSILTNSTARIGGDMWNSHWVLQVPGCLHRVRHSARDLGIAAPWRL